MFGISMQYITAIILLGLWAAFMQWGFASRRPVMERLFHTDKSSNCQLGFSFFSADNMLTCSVELVGFIPGKINRFLVAESPKKTTPRELLANDFLKIIPQNYWENKAIQRMRPIMRVTTRTLRSDIDRVFEAVLLTNLFWYAICASLALLLVYCTIRNSQVKNLLLSMALAKNKASVNRRLRELKKENLQIEQKFVGVLFIPFVVTMTYWVIAGSTILTMATNTNDNLTLENASAYGKMAAVIQTALLLFAEIYNNEELRFFVLFSPIAVVFIVLTALWSQTDSLETGVHVISKLCDANGNHCDEKPPFFVDILRWVREVGKNGLMDILDEKNTQCVRIVEEILAAGTSTGLCDGKFLARIEMIIFENKVLAFDGEWTLFSGFILLRVFAESLILPTLICLEVFLLLYVFVSLFFTIHLEY